jgi:hypothetical protein
VHEHFARKGVVADLEVGEVGQELIAVV